MNDDERNRAARAKYLSLESPVDRFASSSPASSTTSSSRSTTRTLTTTKTTTSSSKSSNSVIDLLKGHPNDAHLPSAAMSRILLRMSKELSKELSSPSTCLNYGDEAGNKSFLSHLASYIGPDCDVKNLFVTNGISHGLDMLTAVLRPSDPSSSFVVFVEKPSYFLASSIFRNHGATVLPAPMLPTGGVDASALALALSSPSLSASTTLLYTIPTNHNPTGFTYDLKQRRHLARTCAAHGCYLVADEVYHFLDWSASGPPPRLYAASGKDPFVVSVGSFTKVFSPGVRCGWVEADEALVARLVSRGFIQSMGGAAPFTGEVMRVALETGEVNVHLEGLKREYKTRSTAMAAMLRTCPKITIPFVPTGGYFMWLKISGVKPSFVGDLRAKHGLVVMDGSAAGMDVGEEDGVYVRLCFACLDT
eukprot:CAMPEP_0197563516 /NCGR_PEP_ID=MMETSP1320-20131121/28903_1 /TAXON_ID=91990 /ORGANISM="Bolidomonas sp., Strain RCC2347" /LENGTH=420 /DNA_ID=CAMNT_0043125337 /DNA_START=25 /DNA_END=1284 /DNA_ORIENTATION=-